MNVTVILCTYNRFQSLARALDSVARLEMPSSDVWEVLVVDNNSNDQTRATVEGFVARYPGKFRYLFEPQAGKSYALNAGIREARGDVLAFIDDDIIVDKDWLHTLIANLDGNTWTGAGGRILPANEFSRPAWLPLEGPNNMGGILALFDLGQVSRELDEPPFGTNMAYRKEMFAKYGGFRTDLGPQPGSELRNEDTEFGRRLLKAGERLRYEPSAVVYHRVPEERLTKEYFLKFCFDHGRASIREVGRRPDILGIPRHYLMMAKISTTLVGRAIRWWATFFNPSLRFYNKAMAGMTRGQIAELWRRSRAGGPPSSPKRKVAPQHDGTI
jgi:glycosyltransferase involved in cell wall biosynthesis